MVTLNDTVWVIVMVCATEELAQKKLAWLEEDKPHNMEYWIEDHILEK